MQYRINKIVDGKREPMKFLNCSLHEARECFKNKKIVFFGNGSWLEMINHTELMLLRKEFAYIIDNNPNKTVRLEDIQLNIFRPEKLREETECIVIITSPVYMYEMYCQLDAMKLNDKIHCYAFPFMQMLTEGYVDKQLFMEAVNIKKKPKIPKMIHSFWFSGEQKPVEYQKCVDTWGKYLSDYEIIEWNMDNYDWHKHPFLERAIEVKAWAFAADYARLDVLNEYGGIYLDMDVEVFKSFDELLGNEAILSFANNVSIDLAVLAAQRGNKIIRSMLRLYDQISLPEDRKGFVTLFQPALVRPVLAEAGIKMNGNLQIIEGATAFPCSFFMPQDAILYKGYKRTEYTYCVHYDNFGWSFDTDNKRAKKIRDNNLLWKMIGEE